MEYLLTRSKRKTISLEFNDDVQLVVKAPLRVNQKQINDFIHSKNLWIEKTKAKLQKKLEATSDVYQIDGTVLFLGKHLKICYNSNVVLKKPIVDLMNQKIFVSTMEESIIQKVVTKTLYQKTNEIFESTLDEMWSTFSQVHAHEKPLLKLRNMKRQWGNLRHTMPTPSLTLNRSLAKSPKQCIEAVVMHELCHLEHKNHQREFYELLLTYMPDYKKRKKLLQNFG